MAFPKLKIADDDGNVADVTGNRLNINLDADAKNKLDRTADAVETIEGAISGSEMQVDIVASLPSGTNAIGKLSANDGVDIGNVDIASVLPGVGALNLGKQEDTAHSSGDVGVQMLAVRKATPVDLSGTDGDYEPLQLDEGRIWASTLVTESVHHAAMSAMVTYAQFDVGTSAIQLSSGDGIGTTVSDCKEIIIQADNDNAGYVMIGDSGVVADTEGIRINAGDTIVLPISSTATPYLRADQASQNVNVMVVK